MNKKEIFIPFLVVGLTLLFAGISFAVFITNGKSKSWVARKMKIGGLLLTITAASCHTGGGEVTCYDTVASNSIWMNAHGEKGIELNLDTSNVLFGRISGVQGSDFSFCITDEKGKKVQKSELIPADGKFDNFDETFKIELNKNTLPGTYQLKLFAVSVNAQDSVQPQNQLPLIIKNE